LAFLRPNWGVVLRHILPKAPNPSRACFRSKPPYKPRPLENLFRTHLLCASPSRALYSFDGSCCRLRQTCLLSHVAPLTSVVRPPPKEKLRPRKFSFDRSSLQNLLLRNGQAASVPPARGIFETGVPVASFVCATHARHHP